MGVNFQSRLQRDQFSQRCVALVLAALFALGANIPTPSHATRFGYDELNRLGCTLADSGKRSWYTYDQAGNRTQVAISSNGAVCPTTGYVASALKLTVLNPSLTVYDTETITISGSQLGTASNAATVSATSAKATCGTASINSGSITYVGPTDANQVCRIDYTIAATGMPAVNGAVLATIGYNNPPVAVFDSMDAAVSTPTAIDPRTNDSDPDGHPLTVIAVTQGATGTTAITGGGTGVSVTETTTVHDKFTYTITDSKDKTASATIYVNDRAPVAVNDGGGEDYQVQVNVMNQGITVLGNDSDPDSDDLTIVNVGPCTPVASATCSARADPTGKFIYVDAGPTVGLADIAYTISDGWGKTASASVRISIRDDDPEN